MQVLLCTKLYMESLALCSFVYSWECLNGCMCRMFLVFLKVAVEWLRLLSTTLLLQMDACMNQWLSIRCPYPWSTRSSGWSHAPPFSFIYYTLWFFPSLSCNFWSWSKALHVIWSKHHPINLEVGPHSSNAWFMWFLNSAKLHFTNQQYP